MSRIRVKNFGPIKEGFTENGGWMDIKKVTLFIGNQGSGKSTVAKLISTFSWMEKVLYRGDYPVSYFEVSNRFERTCLAFHRIENYLRKPENGGSTLIEYRGDRYNFKYENGSFTITDTEGTLGLPQVIYMPAERNFVSSIRISGRSNTRQYSTASPSLADFAITFRAAMEEMSGDMELPTKGVYIEYQQLNGVLYLKGEDYRIRIEEAASGFQSIVPLYLVTWYLANSLKRNSGVSAGTMPDDLEKFRKGAADILSNVSLTEDQKRVALSVLSSRFNKTALINIVEEPEQNLFPSSQKQILFSLLEFNNRSGGNKLIMTTHSPYLINHLTLAIEAKNVLKKIEASPNQELKQKVFAIVPEHSMVGEDEYAIYEMDEATGTITLLKSDEGIPSGKNYLNQQIKVGNDLFDKLLEIDQTLS